MRKDTDDDNLRLQSFLYEKNQYQKEIYFCKEYQTPALDLVLQKAMERNDKQDILFSNGALKFKIDKQKC